MACATEDPVPKSNETMQAAPSRPAADATFWPRLKDLAFSIKFIMVISRKSTSEFEAAYSYIGLRLYRIPTIIVNFYATEASNPHGAVVDAFICLRFWDLATLPNKSFVS